MGSQKEHKKVFIAYIADVGEEVKALEKAIDDLNKEFDRTQFQFDRKTWLDATSGLGRPQERINEELVRECDIFIGVIWKKWGTSTGEYSCGFEEEFNIVLERWRQTQIPEVWIYIKNVDEAALLEEEQGGYQKVKKYIEKIKNVGLYKPFNEKESLVADARNQLTKYLLGLIQPKLESKDEKSKSIIVGSKMDSKGISPKKSSNQIDSLLKNIVAMSGDYSKIDNTNKIRLHLYSSALYYNSNLFETMGNHELHILYKNREKVKPIGIEQKYIFRTILGDEYDQKVGWYWFSNYKKNLIIDYISYICLSDQEKTVKVGALKILDLLWEKRFNKVLLTLAQDSSPEIIKQALKIIRKNGDKRFLPLLDKYMANSDVDIIKLAWSAKLAILAKVDINEAAKYILKIRENRGEYYPEIISIVEKCSLDILEQLLKDNDEYIKLIALKRLLHEKIVNNDVLRLLATSENIRLQELAFDELIERGIVNNVSEIREGLKKGGLGYLLGGGDTEERLIIKIFQRYSNADLENLIEWISLDGPVAYQAYALNNYDTFKERLSKDMEEGFSRIKIAFREKYEQDINMLDASLSEDKRKMIKDKLLKKYIDFDKYDDSIRERFIMATLKAMYLKDDTRALVYARRYLDSTNYILKELSQKIIVKFAQPADLSALKEIALNGITPEKNEATKKAISFWRLDKSQDVIKCFMESNKLDLIKLCYQDALKNNDFHLENIALQYLNNPEDDIRILSLSYLICFLSPKKVRDLLADYLVKGQYYYNVVCWLDRCLFPTGIIRKAFRGKLKSKLF
jgi:hypothetical protein